MHSNSSNSTSSSNNLSFSTDYDTMPFYSLNSFEYEGDINNIKNVWIREPHFIPTVVMYGLAFIVGILGNSLVIFAVVGDRKLRTMTSMFMVSLGVADILFLAVCVPYEGAKYVIDHWALGDVICRSARLIEMLSASASILNLSVVSLERFIVIVLPMKSRSWFTPGTTKRILFIVWAVALILSLPTLYVNGIESYTYFNNETSVVIQDCVILKDNNFRLNFAIYRFLILFALPLLCLTVCYSGVVHALWLSSRQLTHLTLGVSSRTCQQVDSIVSSTTSVNTRKYLHEARNGASNSKRIDVLAARKQVIRMLIAIVVVFVACWGPKLIFDLLKRYHEAKGIENASFMFNPTAFHIQIIVDSLPYLQSCLNPFIYGFMSRNIRRGIIVACKKKNCCFKKCLQVKKPYGYDYELDFKLSNVTMPSRSTHVCPVSSD